MCLKHLKPVLGLHCCGFVVYLAEFFYCGSLALQGGDICSCLHDIADARAARTVGGKLFTFGRVLQI